MSETTPTGATPWATTPSNPLDDIRAAIDLYSRPRDGRPESLWRHITAVRMGLIDVEHAQDFLYSLASARDAVLDDQVVAILGSVPNPPLSPAAYQLLTELVRGEPRAIGADALELRATTMSALADKLREPADPNAAHFLRNRHDRRAAAAQARRKR